MKDIPSVGNGSMGNHSTHRWPSDYLFHLKGRKGDLGNALTMEITSALHQCLSVHPPQHLHDVYLLSLRQPEENKDGQINSSGDAFEFIMEMFRYVVFFKVCKGFLWLACCWRTGN